MNSSSQIERELIAGERLLWSGQPRTGIQFRPSDIFVVPFSLMWCGFAFFWEFSVINSGAPFFFKLWGIPFMVIGLYMVFGRFFVDARTRQQTFYGVTNERIIIVSGLFSRTTRSMELRTLGEISLSEKHDGSGTISFGPVHPMGYSMPAGLPHARKYAAPSFEMIERVKEVYDLIRRAQKPT